MNVKFWGVRGSLHSAPTPEDALSRIESLLEAFAKQSESPKDFLAAQNFPEVAGYGAATTCVQVSEGKESLVLDAGSGIRRLSDHFMSPDMKDVDEYHFLFTHFHWDHLMGLPFFVPTYIPGRKLKIYSPHEDLEPNIKSLWRKPFFPVEYKDLGSTIEFVHMPPRQPMQVAGFQVTPYMLDHPDPCWGYKIERDGKTYSHCVDSEATRVTQNQLGDDLPLYQGVDLMYFDAQYSESDFPALSGWGHATASRGFKIGFREKVKEIIFAHHEPSATVQEIQKLIGEAETTYDTMKKSEGGVDVDWRFAFEGLSIDL